MSFSFVAAGTGTSGNNATLNPALPAGLQEGDILLVLASIRNTGNPNTPTGYELLLNGSNVRVFGKVAGPSESAPSVSFTGGAANADTLAQTAAFRGYAALAFVNSAGNTGTGTNLAYPASPAVTTGRVLAITIGWKQDDWTSLTGDPGTRIGAVSSTAGDDAAMVWSYVLARTTAAIAGSYTVTGGASANTRGLVLHLSAAAGVTITEQDSWPPRVQIAVTGLDTGDVVEIYRVVAGQWTAVRAGSVNGATQPAFVVIDAELPFGRPVSYAVYVNGYETITTPVTYELAGGQVAFTDAITGAVAEAIIGRAGPRTYGRDSLVARVGGDNLVVSGPMPSGGQGTYELLAMTTAIGDGLKWLFRNATQGIVQVRQAGLTGADGNTYDGVDAYLSITDMAEDRFSQDGSDPRRLITITYVEVAGWAADLEARGFTYGDVATFVNGTYADAADVLPPASTYLDYMLADWTA